MDGMAVQETQQISVDVIETIASVTGTDPLSMDPPLYEAVDTDALDTLYERSAMASVEFEYNGHTVRIDSDRTVTVDGEEGR
ncbi:HalOD1 output domain-containing protein [Halosimplex salinum]|uniref:HalOD1 output domain-containing protein n=1 Tax=Halosimplex salinum TaxID=1710538 RepID=UPI000F490313|nr:HalOD1 output domain-containing protein [Halosimplex salinum]